MNWKFSQPQMFWILLAWIPILIAYLHSKRGRAYITPYLPLWERAASEATFWEKLMAQMPLLRFLLTTICLLCFTLAAVGPSVSVPGGGMVHLVLDRSQSMSAQTPSGKTHWEMAKELATKRVQSLRPGDRVSLSVFDEQWETVVGATNNFFQINQALEELKVLPRGSRFDEFELPGESDDALTYFYTDGIGAGEFDQSRFSGLVVEHVGLSHANVGWTQFQLKDSWPSKNLWIYASVKNFSDQSAEVMARVTDGTKVLATKQIRLNPGEEKEESFLFQRGQGGVVWLEISPGDFYLADNQMGGFVLPPPQNSIAVLSPRGKVHPFIQAVGEALAEKGFGNYEEHQDLNTVEPSSIVIANGGSWDIPENKNGKYLLFGSQVSDLVGGPQQEGPSITDWSRDHWLNRRMNFDWFACEKAWTVFPKASPLVWGNQGALFYSYEKENVRIVGTSFEIQDSNLPLQASFPLFVQRAYHWLVEQKGPRAPHVLAGMTFQSEGKFTWEVPLEIGPAKAPWGETYINYVNLEESQMQSSWSQSLQTDGAGSGRRWLDIASYFFYAAMGALLLMAVMDWIHRSAVA